ncbi:MAG: hypothetical protein U9R43_19030 [Thermodesulfobacteriota bacterium]|nr:hypothetical protein [Thermodesulfobacteriota bacterium]
MSISLRIILMGLMSAALLFGFLHLFIPGATLYNFERLHIFLFNLCSGGVVLIYFSESQKELSTKGRLFLILAVSYAILAFAKLYPAAIIVALFLAVIVDSVRIQRFSMFPVNFFKPDAPVSEKFHQAALLCLSIGLVISALVILNNEYFKIISFPKLKLDTFFLGFSFPISLITMSVIFSFMKGGFSKNILSLKNVGFWTVNLGVIIFFVFILYEMFVPQLIVTTILFLSVVLIYFLYTKLGVRVQQKSFLTSGMFFLWYTAVTGILYIILEYSPAYTPENSKLLIRMHSFAALYGWNLSGLAVICRRDDFPIQLHSKTIIAIHWITVIILAPLGTYYWPFAACTIICYVFILYMILFSKGITVATT